MRFMRLCSFLLLLLPLLSAQTGRTDLQVQKVVEEVRAQVNANEAMDFVVRMHELDRWSNFPKFEESARWLQKTMHDIGLRNVEFLSAPADGVSQFGFWTMPLAWDVKQAKLEIVEPAVPPAMRVLADYRQEPASLIMWSGPTPPGGITAEVVELRSSSVQELKSLDVKGKMVLAEAPRDLAERGALKAQLYKMGAAGMISDLTENRDLTNGHYWVNAWGDYGWGFTKVSSPLVGFSITPKQGDYLRRLLGRGVKVRVKAVSDTRYYTGSYSYASGVIQGSGSEEEVLELGHGFELGAQDNATGVAAMLEALAAVNRAIEAGRLKPPKRGIRILAMPEDYGSAHYIATHMDGMKRTIGAICMDTAAGPYDVAGAYSFRMNPDVNRSYQDALIMRVAENYYAGSRRSPRASPYSPTTDSYPSDPLIGVPTISASGSTGAVSVHHNSEDTIDRVDPRSLRDLSAVVGAYLYYLASAGEHEIPWLAGITLNRSYENALRAVTPYLDAVLAAPNAQVLGRELYWGLAKIGYNADRDQEAVLSTLRLASPDRRDALRASLEPVLKSVRRFADDQSERLQQVANGRASELKAAVPVKAITPPADPRRAEASQIIVKRKRFGPVTLDDLPLDQRAGFPGFAGDPAPLRLVYWCDGKRNLAEVIRLIELEQGPMNFDFVGYFKFLAKHRYVDIISAK